MIRAKQLFARNRRVKGKADPVAESHHADRRRHAAEADRTRRHHPFGCNQFGHPAKRPVHRVKVGHAGRIANQRNQHDIAADRLELRRNHPLRLHRRHRERNQRRRHIQFTERTGHAVLAADRRAAELQLGPVSAEQRAERFAPARFVTAEFLKILLQRQPHPRRIAAHRHDLRHRFGDGVQCAMERAPLRQIRIETIAHQSAAGRLAFQHRQLRRHAFRRRRLLRSAVRHQDRRRADRTVEPLDHAALAANIEVSQIGQPGCGQIAFYRSCRSPGKIGFRLRRRCHAYRRMLPNSVGVEKVAADIDDRPAAPVHPQPPRIGDPGDDRRLQVFRRRQFDEFRRIRRVHHHRHPFLRLGNRQLGAVQSVVFLWHRIQVDLQPLGQFADRHRDAASAKIVAFLDQPAGRRLAEQPLNLAFGRRVAFLHFRAARRQ